MNKEPNFKLLNPVEYYYPDYFKNIPSEEEQHSLLIRYRGVNRDILNEEDDVEEIEKSFKIMNELLEKRDYFENVRNIANQLLSNKNPTELFTNMFPNGKIQAEIYRSQFTDACDLILNKDHINWDRMNLPWYNFKKDNGMAGSLLDYSLKINWNNDFWTSEAKKLFLKYWRDRYSKTVLFMSPAKLPSGGVGFFDAEYESSKINIYKYAYYDSHKVNLDYEKRVSLLKEEQRISQEADKYRIQLLLEAERLCWKMWREKNIFSIKEGDSIEYINRMKRKNEQNEIVFKEAFALLIEYDREMGLPITDPDRDFKGAEPINVAEYKKWLTRKGRVIDEDGDENMFLENLFKLNKGVKVKPLKPSFVPLIIEEFVNEQARSDRQNNILRNQSGSIISIDGQKQNAIIKKIETIHIVQSSDQNENLQNTQNQILKTVLKENTILNDENKDAKENNAVFLNVEKKDVKTEVKESIQINESISTIEVPEKERFENKEDLENKFSSILNKIDQVAKDKKEVEKQGFVVIDANKNKKIPKGNPYEMLFADLAHEDEEKDIKESVDISLQENRPLTNDEIDKLYNENDDDKNLIYSQTIEESEDEKGGKDGEGEEKPVWIKEGMLATEEDRRDFNEKRKLYLERKERIKSKTTKVFDRNKQIEKMRSEWKNFPPVKDEGSFWDIAKGTVASFKEGAKNMWKNRVKLNLQGNELNKINALKSLADRVNKIRRQRYDSIEDANIVIYEQDLTKPKKRFKIR